MPVKAAPGLSHPLFLVAELQLDMRARASYCVATTRKTVLSALVAMRQMWYKVRKSECSNRPLTAVAVQVVELQAAGATEAEARQLSVFIDDVIADCFTGKAHRSLDEVDLEEDTCEATENHLNLLGCVMGWTPDLHRQAAAACRKEATVEIERARLHDRLGRALAAGRQS